jgi:hypothetical protein
LGELGSLGDNGFGIKGMQGMDWFDKGGSTMGAEGSDGARRSPCRRGAGIASVIMQCGASRSTPIECDGQKGYIYM